MKLNIIHEEDIKKFKRNIKLSKIKSILEAILFLCTLYIYYKSSQYLWLVIAVWILNSLVQELTIIEQKELKLESDITLKNISMNMVANITREKILLDKLEELKKNKTQGFADMIEVIIDEIESLKKRDDTEMIMYGITKVFKNGDTLIDNENFSVSAIKPEKDEE